MHYYQYMSAVEMSTFRDNRLHLGQS